jgi:hypothetical protein
MHARLVVGSAQFSGKQRAALILTYEPHLTVPWKLPTLSSHCQVDAIRSPAMQRYNCTAPGKLQCIDSTENTTSIKRVIGIRSFLRCAMVW